MSETKSGTLVDYLGIKYVFYKEAQGSGRVAPLSKLPIMLNCRYYWIADTAQGNAQTDRVLIADHPLWGNPQIMELLTVITLRLKLVNNFSYYPNTETSKLIYEKHGAILESQLTEENIHKYCMHDWSRLLKMPVESTTGPHWLEYLKSDYCRFDEDFDKIPTEFITQEIIYEALAKGVLHIGDVKESRLDARAWLEACSTRYRNIKTYKVFQLVPEHYVTQELVENMVASSPQGTCGLLDIIPTKFLSRNVYMNLARICYCYIERSNYDVVSKHVLVVINEESDTCGVCSTEELSEEKKAVFGKCMYHMSKCTGYGYEGSCPGCSFDWWCDDNSITFKKLTDYGPRPLVCGPGSAMELPQELDDILLARKVGPYDPNTCIYASHASSVAESP